MNQKFGYCSLPYVIPIVRYQNWNYLIVADKMRLRLIPVITNWHIRMQIDGYNWNYFKSYDACHSAQHTSSHLQLVFFFCNLVQSLVIVGCWSLVRCLSSQPLVEKGSHYPWNWSQKECYPWCSIGHRKETKRRRYVRTVAANSIFKFIFLRVFSIFQLNWRQLKTCQSHPLKLKHTYTTFFCRRLIIFCCN